MFLFLLTGTTVLLMINLALLLTRTQNYVWVSVKLYNQHKNENQSPSVKNSHQCHYSRLWKYIHQISYRSHRRSVNVGGHLVYFLKKKDSHSLPLQIQYLSSPQSLCLCLSHSLSLSHKPPASYAPQSLPVLLSVFLARPLLSFSFPLYCPTLMLVLSVHCRV